jgi:hypothetical protein
VTGEEWISSFAERIGVERPSHEQIDAILRLAAIAAHASERTSAPVACWMAGGSGRSLEDLCQLAEGLE